MKKLLFILPLVMFLVSAAAYADEVAPHAVERISGLTGSMKDPDPAVRAAAARSLGDMKDKSAVPALSAMLVEDKDDDVRLAALGALLVISDRQAMPAYMKALKDESGDVRQSAAEALSGIWDDAGEKALINVMLTDRLPRVRRCAAESLGKPGEGAGPDPLHPEDEQGLQNALVQALKKDESYEVRTAAATVLGELKGDKSLDPLLDALSNDKNPSVRAAAAEAVGFFESDKAVEPLINVLYFEKDDSVVLNAIKALKYSTDPSIGEPLVAQLKSGSERVRWQAIDLIETLRLTDAADQLREISGDVYESDGVRTKASEALELLGEDD